MVASPIKSRRVWAIILVCSLMIIQVPPGDTQIVYAQSNYRIYLPLISKNYPAPPAAPSYYVTKIDGTSMFLRGDNLGLQDAASPSVDYRLIILDFGRMKQQGSSYGTSLPFDPNPNPIFQSTTVIANAAREFARGYWVGLGSDTTTHVRIVVSANNCCDGDTTSFYQGHGTAWAQMMNLLPSMIVTYTSQITVTAGSDIEDWNRPYNTVQWFQGYLSTTNCNPGTGDAGCLYNFGNQIVAVPTTFIGPCNYTNSAQTTWAACDFWYVSWGIKKAGDPDPFVRPLPEIYHAPSASYTYGYDANQWAALSVYSVNLQSAGPIYFVGSLTQYARCGDVCVDPKTGLSYNNNHPDKGWYLLMDALGSNSSTAQFVHWSTDITKQP